MSIPVIDTLHALGNFPVVDYTEVQCGNFRLDAVLSQSAASLALKADKTYVDSNFAKKSEAGTYSKPSGGIPKTDLASDVQTLLGKADTALQVEQYTGTYSKPSGGIPKSDLDSAVRTSLGKADTALQSHQDISGKADKTYVDSGLSVKADKTYVDSGFSFKADNSTVSSLSARVSSVETEQDALSARMDTFTALEEGSTTGDAELIDIRVGVDGTTYESAGTSVRSQITNINKNVGVLENATFDETVNVFNKNNVKKGYILQRVIGTSSINDYSANANGFCSNQIWSVKKGDVIRTTAVWGWLVIYNENNVVCETSNGSDTYTVTSQNAAKMRYYAETMTVSYLENCMITINNNMPSSYTAHYSSKISAVDAKVDNIKSRDIASIKSDISESKKNDYINGIPENFFNKSDIILGKELIHNTSSMYDALTDSVGGFTANQIWEVNAGDVIKCNTTWASFDFYDANGDWISRANSGTIKYIVPNSAKYMRLSCNQRTDAYLNNFVFVINSTLPDRPVSYTSGSVKESCKSIKNEIGRTSYNVFDKSCIVFNKSYLRGDTSSINSTKDSTCMISTQLFSVKPGDIVRVNKTWSRFNFYNENGIYVGTLSDENKQFTVPENVYYMRYQYEHIDQDYADEFMMTINNDMPAAYEHFGNISEIDNINERITAIENTISVDDKAVLVMDFDQDITENDIRIGIMDTYGWKPTFTNGVTPEITKSLLAKGWDLSTYWAQSNVPTDSQLSEDSDSALGACKLYVRTGLANQEANGFFNPVSWSCRQNKYGPTLGKALQYYGYKIVRGGTSGTYGKKLDSDFTRTGHNAIFTNTIDTVKSAIDSAVSNKQAVTVFTHYVVESESEDRGYDCLKSVYLELMNYIKAYENEGKLIVTNYRDFYAMQYPNQSHENDYNRTIKRMNYIESKI